MSESGQSRSSHRPRATSGTLSTDIDAPTWLVRFVPIGDSSPEGMQGSGSRISDSVRAYAHRCPDQSGTHFEDHVERRLSRAAEAHEARFSRDLTQSAFPRLGTEAQAHFLRE
jgi:hypothetical protein